MKKTPHEKAANDLSRVFVAGAIQLEIDAARPYAPGCPANIFGLASVMSLAAHTLADEAKLLPRCPDHDPDLMVLDAYVTSLGAYMAGLVTRECGGERTIEIILDAVTKKLGRAFRDALGVAVEVAAEAAGGLQ